MGPAGAGKSTVGVRLASEMGWRFTDADAFHSAASLARFARGEGLSDEDRAPWLGRLAVEIETTLARRMPMVLACSALRRAYRRALLPSTAAAGDVQFVYLRVRPATLAARLSARHGHVAGPALLPSQLALLEEPSSFESVITLDGEQPVEDLVRQIRHECGV
jgi:gluconokinase